MIEGTIPLNFSDGGKGFSITIQTSHAVGDKSACRVVYTNQGNAMFSCHQYLPGEFSPITGVHRAGPQSKVMPVDCHVPTLDVENSRHNRSPVKFPAPVLISDVGGFLRQHVDPFPDCHPVFLMLSPYSRQSSTLTGFLPQFFSSLEHLMVDFGMGIEVSRKGVASL